jgi:hypothetical protein
MRIGGLLAFGFAAITAPAGVAHAGGGAVFIPPMEVELGHAVSGAPDGSQDETTQLLVGVSWASLWPKPTPVDISVGVISTFHPAADDAMAAARGSSAPPPDGDTACGGYIDVAVRGASGKHWRTWIGGRGELMDHGRINALGGAARASVEVWAGTAAGDRNAFLVGTVALSAWAETGLREQPYGGAASFVAAGLGVRVPLILAAN